MMLYYTGLTISAILFFLGFVFALLGIYFGFNAHNPYNPQTSPPLVKLNIKYGLGFGICLGLSLFIFLTTENGFSWDTVFFSSGLIIMSSILIFIDSFIRSKTTAYLYKRRHNIPFSSLWLDDQTKVDEDKKSE
jgi:H+/Cl- antiporter ClcA